MRDEILLECKNCKDSYIGTTHTDGYRCPRCGSRYLIGVGKIKELEEYKKQLEIKIKSARWNGNIKDAIERKTVKQNYDDKNFTTVLNVKDNDIVIVRLGCLLPLKETQRIEEVWSNIFMKQGFNNIKVIALSSNYSKIEVLSRE